MEDKPGAAGGEQSEPPACNYYNYTWNLTVTFFLLRQGVATLGLA